MAYFNVLETLASSVDATASFTTGINIHNHDNAAFQVVWTGVDADTATIRMQGSNDNSNYENLTTNPTTMTSAADNHIFNVTDAAYHYLRLYYDDQSTSGGTITSVIALKKNRGR